MNGWMNQWMYIWMFVCYCHWKIILRFFSVSRALLLLLLLLLLYESNVNRAHKEKLLPPIAVMHVEVKLDTPRYCDYGCMCVSSRSVPLSLSLFPFFSIKNLLFEECVERAIRRWRARVILYRCWHNTLFSFSLCLSSLFYAWLHIIIYIQLHCSVRIYTCPTQCTSSLLYASYTYKLILYIRHTHDW
jgi:hypothetical protein